MKTGTKIGLVLGGVMIIGYFASAATLGAEIGQSCDKEWGCKGLSASCLEGPQPFCSRACEADGDCPSGWSCGDVAVLTFDGKSEKPEESSTKMCLPRS
ncbi:MAG TPA: hypothetical protein VG755_36720 [Nannocystaceae bacterium]|nr:hypothetical protein [Nannocystaceae bacterium]